MNEERMLKPALIGGVAMGVLSSLFSLVPILGCCCCIWVIGGGVLAAYLYVKDQTAPVTLGRGVALGLLTGFIGGIVMGIFSIPIHMLSGANVAEEMRRSMESLPNVPPESRRIMENLFAREGIQTIFYIAQFIMMSIASCILSMLGGAIGVALFEKRKPGAPPDAPQYQPPTIPPPPPPAPPAPPSSPADPE